MLLISGGYQCVGAWLNSSGVHCVPRAPVYEVSSHPYQFAYCLNIYQTMYFVQFRPCCNAVFKLRGRNWVKCIVLYVFKAAVSQIFTEFRLKILFHQQF